MSRLTDHSYLSTRSELRSAWDADPTSFFLLNAMEQWALHDFFRFTENLSPGTLREYRQEIGTQQPSLPQRAGRAVTQWRLKQTRLEVYRSRPPVARAKKKGNPYEIKLFAEVKPQLDPAQVARALMADFWNQQAREETRRQR